MARFSCENWRGIQSSQLGWPFFSWAASLGKILSTDNLWKRGIIELDWWCMCKRCGESMDHLLLHCPMAYKLWTMVFCLFGLQWVIPKSVINLFVACQGSFGRHRNIAFWKVVPHCIIRCLWWERNDRSSESCEWSFTLKPSSSVPC